MKDSSDAELVWFDQELENFFWEFKAVQGI
jgi:hypothetical protein